jgi:hypothetical protein
MGEEAGQDAAKKKTRFDQLIVDLLKDHEGVFLGEWHIYPGMRQSVTKLLPRWKANGVETLSCEMAQAAIDAIRPEQSYADYKKENGVMFLNQNVFEFIRTAKQLGMNVLGHEHPNYVHLEEMRTKLEEGTKTGEFSGFHRFIEEEGRKATTPWAWCERDAWAADYIAKHKVGKVLVFGGAGHSGGYRREDLAGIDPSTVGAGVIGDYQGLDKWLGYPSVDYRTAAHMGEVGTTAKAGTFSDYTVSLPPDLLQTMRAYGMTSWPRTAGKLHSPQVPAGPAVGAKTTGRVPGQ